MIIPQPHPRLYRHIVRTALAEDLEHGDITTMLTIDDKRRGRAVIMAKEDCICAGLFVADTVFRTIDPECASRAIIREGAHVKKGAVLMETEGRLSSILQAERVALNFIQRMCGIATLTRSYVDKLAGTGCKICDTRKTTPGLKVLEKYAVTAGGGSNHRFSLSDGILIKDNHIAACGGVREAVEKAVHNAPHGLRIEVEVSDEKMIQEAIEAGADILLLDNMETGRLHSAVRKAREIKSDIVLEASGNITLDNIAEKAMTGVDIISSGALTHSCRAIDLSLRITHAAQ